MPQVSKFADLKTGGPAKIFPLPRGKWRARTEKRMADAARMYGNRNGCRLVISIVENGSGQHIAVKRVKRTAAK